MKKVVILLISSILILFGCSSQTQGEEIIFWTPFTGPDGEYMNNIVNSYNESQDQYTVTIEILPAGADYYATVDTALSEQSGPDLMIMHGNTMYTYIQKGQLMDLTGTEIGNTVTSEIYHPSAVDNVTFDDKVYGVPLDIHPVVLYYNKDMFEAAGLDPEDPPSTWQEFVDYAVKLTDPSKDQWGFVVNTGWMTFLMPTLVYQQGGELISEDGTPQFDSPEVEKAITFLYDLVYTYNVSPEDDSGEDMNMFITGNNAMSINGPWALTQVTESDINWGVAPLPYSGEQVYYVDSHNFVIPAYVSDEKLAGIQDFLTYVSENAIEWANSGQAPASNVVLEDPALQEMPIQSTAASTFDYAEPAPEVENYLTLTDILFGHCTSILLGEETIEEGLAQAQAEALSMIEQQ